MKTRLEKLSALLTTDFCPGANIYVYWLKQPVGWFVVALLCSLLIGAFFSPVGWALAAGIAVITVLGLGFPWLATHVVRTELSCQELVLTEGTPAFLTLKIRNPLPIPVIGLVVENYFSPTRFTDAEDSNVECGLARVPPLSSAEYQLPISPYFRGRYPIGEPRVSCGFPFGIYTSRRPLRDVAPVLVRPLIVPLSAEFEVSGARIADVGEGSRATDHGDFLGVREFRRGDSLKSIHWSQSARKDNFVVCERGGPQKSPLMIRLDTRPCAARPGTWDARENLAWRVRIAASFVDFLNARRIPFELWIDHVKTSVPHGNAGLGVALDHLAVIPHESPDHSTSQATDSVEDASTASDQMALIVDARAHAGPLSDRFARVRLMSPGGQTRAEQLIDLDQRIDEQLEAFLQGAHHDCAV